MTNNPQQADSSDFYPSSPAGAIAVFFAGLILLIAFLTGIIANWNTFVVTSSGLVQVLIFIAGFGLCAFLMAFGAYRAYMTWLHIQHEREDLAFKQDERRRA